MHYFLTLTALATSAYAGCKDATGRNCYWQGRSPGCGQPTYNLGQYIRGNELVADTVNDSVSTLLANKNITEGCYEDYGAGCIFGHKNLFCAPLGKAINDADSDNPTTPMSGGASTSAAGPGASAGPGATTMGVPAFHYVYTFNADGSLAVAVTFDDAKNKPCMFNVTMDADTFKSDANDVVQKQCLQK